MSRLGIPTTTLYVKKTGLPFYDASRLIGVAHLFFGTASAEVEDKGAFWVIYGSESSRDKDQILWIMDELLVPRAKDVQKKIKALEQNFEKIFQGIADYFGQPNSIAKKDTPLMAMDTSLLTGIRGFDPLARYSLLAPQTSASGAKYKDDQPEIIASTFGLSYAARSWVQKETNLILPIFGERFVIGGFLNFRRNFSHQAGGSVTTVWAALSILSDLIGKPIPVIDFVYNKIVQQTFYESGYLGYERLCSNWQEGKKNALREIKLYLEQTRNEQASQQRLALARALARFAINPTVTNLEAIQKLKARLLIALTEGEGQNRWFASELRFRLWGNQDTLKEVISMTIENEIPIPEGLTWAVAKSLIPSDKPLHEAKGWFNKFVRLENLGTADRFFAEIERIISRATYDPDQTVNRVFGASKEELQKIRQLAVLQDNKTFRAFKAVFLLEVLSKLRGRPEGADESPETPAESET